MNSVGELSARNVRVREAAKLVLKKFRRQTGCILIEGSRLVLDALDAGANVTEVFCTSAFLASAQGRHLEARRGGILTVIAEGAAAKLSDTQAPQGVFAVVEFVAHEFDDVVLGPDALVLVAGGISDPGNLGTMIRSAAALGASCVVAPGESCDVLNPKTVRATMGAIFRVSVVAGQSLGGVIDALRSRGLRIVAAVAGGGRPPWNVDLRPATALLIGSEAEGLPDESIRAADELVTIPMPGQTESLNAAASAAVLLYEAARQRTGNR